MANRNTNLGGTDWNKDDLLTATDLNDTFDAAYDAITSADTIQEVFNNGNTITIADTENKSLIITQNDVTNNPNAVNIINTTTGASLAINTNEFIVKADGKVGLGITAPSGNLHINSATGNTRIDLSSTDGSGNQIIYFNDGVNNEWHIQRQDSDNSFQIIESGVAERITVLAGGNVGIGTTAPAYKLDINGQVRLPNNQEFLINNSSGTAKTILFGSAGDELTLRSLGTALVFQSSAGSELGSFEENGDFIVDGTTLVVDASENKVGIGTTTPNEKLDVNGAFTIRNGIRTSVGANVATFDNYNGGLRIFSFGPDATTRGNFNVKLLESDGGNEITPLSITSAGLVGIGMTATKTLDVNGEIRASTGILFGTDTAAANTLDDYEEGTWTPTDASGTGLSFSSVEATYTKIGNTVRASFNLTYQATADTADSKIGGLPFTCVANSTNGGFVTYTSTNVGLSFQVGGGETAFYLWNGTGARVDNNILGGTILRGVLIYTV